jgi:hypothetical protein
MTATKARWIEDNREKRQHILQELSQLKQMSLTLRTRSMRAFIERSAAARRPVAPAKLKTAAPSTVAA